MIWPWVSVNTSPWGSSALPVIPKLALVVEPVVSWAEAGKVPGIGRAVAVVGVPVDDVVDVQHPIRSAAGDAAAAVAQGHESAGAFGHGALGASDADGDAAVLVDGVDDGVATDQVAQPGWEAVAEPVDHGVVDVDMDVDPVAIPPPDVGDRIQRAVGDLDQRVGFRRGVRRRVGTGHLGLL